MWRSLKERANALEPVATKTPLDVGHSSALEHAREDEICIALGIDARHVDLRKEPAHRSWQAGTGASFSHSQKSRPFNGTWRRNQIPR
jgi:hypothetical protein